LDSLDYWPLFAESLGPDLGLQWSKQGLVTLPAGGQDHFSDSRVLPVADPRPCARRLTSVPVLVNVDAIDLLFAAEATALHDLREPFCVVALLEFPRVTDCDPQFLNEDRRAIEVDHVIEQLFPRVNLTARLLLRGGR
jgi:hypothetical protein